MVEAFNAINAAEMHKLCIPRELGGLNSPLLLYFLCGEMVARARHPMAQDHQEVAHRVRSDGLAGAEHFSEPVPPDSDEQVGQGEADLSRIVGRAAVRPGFVHVRASDAWAA